jgi:hypothetical protein
VYLTDGRFSLPKNPAVLDVAAMSQAALGLAEVERSSPTESMPLQSALTLAVTHTSVADAMTQQDTEETSSGAEEATPLRMH